MDTVEEIAIEIQALDQQAMESARQRQLQLTKPPGSLGRLEALSIQLAGITGQAQPRVDSKAIVVMAGDHGVTAEGVSAYPAEVTPQMVLNFLHGGAAINVLARQVGARVVIVDMGVAAPLDPHDDLLDRKVALGTANMAQGPAMTIEQAEMALAVGRDLAAQLAAEGVQLLGTGEMGIGNTTPSSALTAVLTGAPVADVVGRGTGVDDDGLARKVEIVERALQVNRPAADEPLAALAKVGGFEIAGLAGLILGAAQARVPVVIDGFITGAAALVAARLAPAAVDYMIASHQSVEIGHRVILENLGLVPLFKLDLRLGEGTGAALAMHTIEAAARVLREMATFESAGVSDKA
ncbi:MAG TPA: nicotinate-nucleotide--dimethylbenzimidazole phosphoribosyltransferase [Anaerolineales bacterium]|jgi:nicotinate-nucleotide--dimethylbenzimidazole phosphoribosyltransferase